MPHAAKASPPKPGKATLVFVHVPKTGGTSLEQAFARLTDTRPPLCSRRFMDSFEGCSVEKRDKVIGCAVAVRKKKPEVKGCPRNASNLLWGHLSLDLDGSRRIINPTSPLTTPPTYSMIFLREPIERLVSLANYLGIAQSKFTASWGRQMAANTQTSMINGLRFVGPLNKNRFAGEPLSCMNNQEYAVAEAKRRLFRTFTFVGTTESYVASLWLAQRVFGWGEGIVFDSLVHPREGFKTKYAINTHLIPFKSSDVDKIELERILAGELCDSAVHDFATGLLRSRLLAMSSVDQAAFREFERKLQQAGVKISPSVVRKKPSATKKKSSSSVATRGG